MHIYLWYSKTLWLTVYLVLKPSNSTPLDPFDAIDRCLQCFNTATFALRIPTLLDQKIPLLGHEGLYQATRAPIKPQGPLSGRKGFLLGHRCSLFGNYGQLFWAYIMMPIHYEGHHSHLSEYKGFMPNHKGLLPSHKGPSHATRPLFGH